MTFHVKVRGENPNAVVEWLCPACGIWETREARGSAPDVRLCPTCEAPSVWTISAAPAFKPQYGAVQMGTSAERPPDAMDTRPLADGMPMGKWKQQRRKKNWERRRAKFRKEVL